jgi:hypothetical protein
MHDGVEFAAEVAVHNATYQEDHGDYVQDPFLYVQCCSEDVIAIAAFKVLASIYILKAARLKLSGSLV